jgi:hypothetical protein
LGVTTLPVEETAILISFYTLVGIKIEYYCDAPFCRYESCTIYVGDFFEKCPSFERFWGAAENESKNETTNAIFKVANFLVL